MQNFIERQSGVNLPRRCADRRKSDDGDPGFEFCGVR